MRQLRGRGCFTGAVDADDEDDFRLRRQRAQRRRIERETLCQLLPCDFDDVVGGDLLVERAEAVEEFRRSRPRTLSYTLSLHDVLPPWRRRASRCGVWLIYKGPPPRSRLFQ